MATSKHTVQRRQKPERAPTTATPAPPPQAPKFAAANVTPRGLSFSPLGFESKCFVIPAGMPREHVANVTACCIDVAKNLLNEHVEGGASEHATWAAVILLNVAAAGLDALAVAT